MLPTRQNRFKISCFLNPNFGDVWAIMFKRVQVAGYCHRSIIFALGFEEICKM